MIETQVPPKKQISRLLLVLGAGVVFAGLVAGYFLYQYGPSGRYLVNQVLLSPASIEKLSYSDTNPRSGGISRFVFDKLEFSYWNSEAKQWKRTSISKEAYSQFYKALANTKSLANVNESSYKPYQNSHNSSLIITVKTDSTESSKATSKVFQEMQFTPQSDHFRIELHGDNIGDERWVYFDSPIPYSTIYQLLVSP